MLPSRSSSTPLPGLALVTDQAARAPISRMLPAAPAAPASPDMLLCYSGIRLWLHQAASMINKRISVYSLQLVTARYGCRAEREACGTVVLILLVLLGREA